MRLHRFAVLVVVAVCGCLPPKQQSTPATMPSATIPLLTSRSEYPKYIGQTIEVVGEVTNTKCPYVEGIDCWDLDAHRGKKVRIRGILRQTVVTKEQFDPMIAMRGPGTFYRLENMEFEVVP